MLWHIGVHIYAASRQAVKFVKGMFHVRHCVCVHIHAQCLTAKLI